MLSESEFTVNFVCVLPPSVLRKRVLEMARIYTRSLFVASVWLEGQSTPESSIMQSRSATLDVPAAVASGYAEVTRHAFDRLCAWLCDEACPHLRMTSDSVFVERGQRLRHGQCVRGAGPLASRCAEEHRHRVRGGQRPHGHPGMLAERIPSQCQSLHARLSGCVELLQGDATQTSSAWMRMRCDGHARVPSSTGCSTRPASWACCSSWSSPASCVCSCAVDALNE